MTKHNTSHIITLTPIHTSAPTPQPTSRGSHHQQPSTSRSRQIKATTTTSSSPRLPNSNSDSGSELPDMISPTRFISVRSLLILLPLILLFLTQTKRVASVTALTTIQIGVLLPTNETTTQTWVSGCGGHTYHRNELALNATLLGFAELNSVASLGMRFEPITLNVVSSTPTGPTLTDYLTIINSAAAIGINFLFDLGNLDADLRSGLTSQLSTNGQQVWSPSYTEEECYFNFFSTGSTPNIILTPNIAWLVTRFTDAWFFPITITASVSGTSHPKLLSNGLASQTMMTEQLRWSGGLNLGTGQLDLDSLVSSTTTLIQTIRTAIINQQTISAAAGSLVANPHVILLADLPNDLYNTLLSAMISANMTQRNNFGLLAVNYDEYQLEQLQCNIITAGVITDSQDLPHVFSGSSYFNTVNTTANMDLHHNFMTTYSNSIPPVFTDLVVASYTGVKLFGAALASSSSFDPTHVAAFARSASYSAPEGLVKMNLHQHASRKTRLGEVSWDLTGTKEPTFNILYQTHEPRKSQVWHPYIPTNVGYQCDWNDLTRGSRYLTDYVRVGILHSVTGALAFSERSVVDAELLAIEEINTAGGVLGKQIIPVFRDGSSNWPLFATEADYLCNQTDITSIFGCWTSVSRKYVKPVVESHNKLLWYPVQYEGQECSNNIFYSGAAPNQQIEPSLDWLLRNHPKQAETFFLVGSDYVFPRTANSVIKAYLATLKRSTTIVGEEYIPLTGITVPEILVRVNVILQLILQTMPNGGVIYNTLNGDSNIVWFKRMADLGMTPQKYPTMSVSIAESEIDQIGKDLLLGHYASWNYFQSVEGGSAINTEADLDAIDLAVMSGADISTNVLFVSSFKGIFGLDRVVNDPMEAGYINLYIWKQAAEQAGMIDVTNLRTAAYGQVFDAPEGLVTMNSNHHVSKFVRIGQVNAAGQFDIVSNQLTAVKPVPWNEFINTTAGHRCDWKLNEEFYEYPAVKVAVLLSLDGDFTDSERGNLDSLALAVEQINTGNTGLLTNSDVTLDIKVMDDAGDITLAQTNLQLALSDPTITALFISSPLTHQLLYSSTAGDSLRSSIAASGKYVSTLRSTTSDTADSCQPNIVSFGSTFNQYIEPGLDHLLDQGHKQFVLFMPIASTVELDHLLLKPNDIQTFVQSVLQARGIDLKFQLDVVTIPDDVDLAGMNTILRTVITANPSKASFLNFLSFNQSYVLFNSFLTVGATSANYPILSFHLDLFDVRTMVSLSTFSSSLVAGHSFTASWTLDPSGREMKDLQLSIQEEHGSTVVTSMMDASYTAMNVWTNGIRAAQSLDSDQVRQAAYVINSQPTSSATSAGLDILHSSNYVRKYFHIAKLGRNSKFEVLYPTNGLALLIEPDPFRFLASSPTNGGVCQFGPQQVELTYSTRLKAVSNSFFGIAVALVVVCFGITLKYRDSPVIKQISPVFCLLTQVSLLLLNIAGLVLSLEPTSSNGVCLARVWLTSLSVSLICSFLFAKMWRLHTIFNAKTLASITTLSNTKLLQHVCVVNTPLVLILIIWSGVDAPSYTPVISVTDSTYNTIGLIPQCSSNTTFVGLIIAFMLCVLLFGLLLAYLTKDVPDKYNEGRYVIMSLILIIFFGIILVPLNYLLDTSAPTLVNAGTLLISRSIGALFASMAITLTLFLPFFIQLGLDSLTSKVYRLNGNEGSKLGTHASIPQPSQLPSSKDSSEKEAAVVRTSKGTPQMGTASAIPLKCWSPSNGTTSGGNGVSVMRPSDARMSGGAITPIPTTDSFTLPPPTLSKPLAGVDDTTTIGGDGGTGPVRQMSDGSSHRSRAMRVSLDATDGTGVHGQLVRGVTDGDGHGHDQHEQSKSGITPPNEIPQVGDETV